jgi:hypothetical protein
MRVAIAGLLSYIGLFGYIFWPPRTSGKSLDRSRRGASVAEWHLETTDHLQQDIAVRPAGRAIAGSGLVRRLVRAKDDPAKQRIRAQLSEIDDEQLFGIGLTSEDVAALRGTATPPSEATIVQALDAPSEDSSAYQISPPIAGVLDATHDMWRHESDTPRREHARFSEPVRSGQVPSWADFITTTPELKFSVHTTAGPSNSRKSSTPFAVTYEPGHCYQAVIGSSPRAERWLDEATARHDTATRNFQPSCERATGTYRCGCALGNFG